MPWYILVAYIQDIRNDNLRYTHYYCSTYDQGYGRGGTPVFTGVFEPLARVTLYPHGRK